MQPARLVQLAERQGIYALKDVRQELCEQYLEARSWSVPEPDQPQRRLDPGTLSEIVRTMKLVPLYGELLSTDGHRPGFIPWPGKTAAQVVGAKSGRANRVPPVPDHILQPLLATCLYLVNDIGPHLADLLDELRADTAAAADSPRCTVKHLPAIQDVLAQMRAAREPLPAISAQKAEAVAEHSDRDPLAHLAANRPGRNIGVRELSRSWAYRHLKESPDLLEVAAEVGFAGAWARTASPIPQACTREPVPFTKPLADGDVEIMAGYVLTACLILTCALSGMRTSELAEITVGARSCEQPAPGTGSRFRLASRVIKWKPFGGVPDEWVVIEEVDRAVALAERLVGRPVGEPHFSTSMIGDRLVNLRNWLERSGNRERWGLALIPQGPVNARMLRRTLAQAIAERPGGLLAAKIALKHISVATTEGYAAGPGGSQRLFLAEIEEAEDEHHVQLTVQAFRDVQAGRLPAGPGARSLIEAFAHVDAELKEAARSDPKVLADDAHLESLLRGLLGEDIPAPAKRPRGLRSALTDGDGWRAAAFTVAYTPIGLVLFAVTVMGRFYGLAALTYPFWWRALEGDGRYGIGFGFGIEPDTWPQALLTAVTGAGILVVTTWSTRGLLDRVVRPWPTR
ncbi:sensor domain-containing protein [Streptomyces sp. NPDC091376]|uniref:sensor domain-containing protein n=1 Tax=Streptomyces sp. NPDC091376 TaxID=3365994 RepID=UPI00380B52FF